MVSSQAKAVVRPLSKVATVLVELKADREIQEEKLKELNKQIEYYHYHPSNWIFSSPEDVGYILEDELQSRASEACEGSYNCGQDAYTQLFYVGDVLHEARLDCEYNRHDKTYYYLEESKFSTRVVEDNEEND